MNRSKPLLAGTVALLCAVAPADAMQAAPNLGTPAHAHDKTQPPDKTAEIDRIFGWTAPDAPGAVVAVSVNGQMVANRAYGLADLERNVPLSTSSVFDIGSLRKQFIAAAILLLVEDGRLSLDDDVRKHVPELPDYGHTITLDHLLTHTSGLRDWTGMLPLTGGNADVLALILRQRGINFTPGEEWAYSNSGYVLLKEIVVRASGMSFPEFTRKRLFEPLGMTMTTYEDDLRDVIENRALAYEKEGDAWKMAMLLDEERGGGGALFSTAADLVTWNDALTNKRLGQFVSEKLQEPAKLSNGRQLKYARGLIVEPHRAGGTLIWHGGGAAGYSSLAARFPEHGLSIAIVRNADEGPEGSALAARIFDLLVPAADREAAEAPGPAADAAAAGVAGVDLSSRTGLFFSEDTGGALRLAEQGGRLRIVGGPALVPVAEDRFRNERGDLFFRSQDEFELRFLSPLALELTSMEGETTRYRRAKGWAPTAAELEAFAGRYGSDEIGSVLEMVPGEDGLVMRLELSPEKALAFRPVDTNTFQFSRMLVRFQRDEVGKVVAFDYSNPVVRNIRFTRVSEPE